MEKLLSIKTKLKETAGLTVLHKNLTVTEFDTTTVTAQTCSFYSDFHNSNAAVQPPYKPLSRVFKVDG